MSFPLPPDEAARLAALERYAILDTPPEPAYDDLARLAAVICDAPAAAVRFVDADRLWTKARAGARADLVPGEVARGQSFCAHTITLGAPLVVDDARVDARFRGLPVVAGSSAVRFYAGAPIVGPDGHAVGTICILDVEPRRLAADQIDALAALGRQAARALELRQHVSLLEQEIEVRAAAEEALYEREEQLRLFVQHTPASVAMFDRELRYVVASDRWLEMTGLTRAEVDERTLLDTYPALPGHVRASLDRVLAGGVEQADEDPWPRPDGSTMWLRWECRPWHAASGAIGGVVACIEDVTARSEVDRLKNEFVSTVSHELRTPLTSIRGSLGLIEAGVVGEVSPRARELTRIARTNADRLIRLINDILDLEKMEAGRLEMRVTPLDPSDVVTTTLEELQGMAEQRRIRLIARLARHDRVLGDRDRVVQVLTNLVSNAVKFSPERGDVVVRAVAGDEPGTLRFVVEDAGPGIAPEKLERLFRRFAQLDASDSRTRGGTGLGLAISRTIVEQLGGRIGVESTPGVATRFWFELPTVAQPRDAAATYQMPEQSPHSVLVVEDDGDLADILSILLTHEGFEVAHAATLAEAATSLEHRAPSAMLLDVSLPDGDGLEWIARRSARGDATVPVVVLSGHEPGERATTPEVREWLTKPSDERLLFAALRRAVRPPGPPRALVVDADAEARQVRVAQLASWGVSCREAGDGVQAYAIARGDAPDLIVLDPALPSLDGFSLVGRLRQGRARMTPLLVHASRELTAAERRTLALGPTAHLVKSVASEAELARAMRALLDAFVLADAGGVSA